MTAIEARVAALEANMVLIIDALERVAISQTMFSSVVTMHLREMLAQVKRLRDEFNDGDEWKGFP